MEVLIFLIVIVALIVVHEVGHFVVAKWSGMRVDEFGLGYPPRAALLGKIGETEITLNWLPFGGFVKIYGEDMNAEQAPDPRAFSSKNRLAQAFVLVAGIAMNLVFAYILITLALFSGTPRALEPNEIAHAQNLQLAVADTVPGSPAAVAGLVAGDLIVSAQDAQVSWQASDPASFSDFVAADRGPIELSINRNGTILELSATPLAGVAPSDPTRYALGVEIVTIGVVPLSFINSITQGAEYTYQATILTAQGLWQFFVGVFTFHANLSQVTGPVGIAGAVGSAAKQGFGDLLSLTALISINLALINLIPVPALDGGRLLFVIIESITRRRINPNFYQAVNMAGFALLILLMVVVTFHDVYKLIG